MKCDQCNQTEGKTYGFSYTAEKNQNFQGTVEGVFCDKCVENHRSRLRLESILLLVGGIVILGLWLGVLIPNLPGDTQFNAWGLNGFGKFEVGLFYYFILLIGGFGTWLCLLIFSIEHFALVRGQQWKVGTKLLERRWRKQQSEKIPEGIIYIYPIEKPEVKSDLAVVNSDEPEVAAFYQKMKSKSSYERSNAAVAFLKSYKTKSLKHFFLLMKSDNEDVADTALRVLEYELEKCKSEIDPGELEALFSQSMPYFSEYLKKYRLQSGWQYLDPYCVRVLHILAKYGDSSVVPALTSLIARIKQRRQKDGYIRQYVQTESYGGWMDNDGWDSDVQKTIDAINLRSMSPQKSVVAIAQKPEPKRPVETAPQQRRVGNLIDYGNGTVGDSATGLMWQKEDDGTKRNYEDAIAYCNRLNLGGCSGWRLPTGEELMTIVSIGAAGNTIDLLFNAKPERYWTSTEVNLSIDTEFLDREIVYAYTVDFANGQKTTYKKKFGCYVRAVRTPLGTSGTQTVRETRDISQAGGAKYCTYTQRQVEVKPMTGYLTCTNSLFTADACQQGKCRYHNTMVMSAFLQKSMLNPNAKDEDIFRSLGAKDFCK